MRSSQRVNNRTVDRGKLVVVGAIIALVGAVALTDPGGIGVIVAIVAGAVALLAISRIGRADTATPLGDSPASSTGEAPRHDSSSAPHDPGFDPTGTTVNHEAARPTAAMSTFVVSLARRNGGLVDQQLALLDTLEMSVEDPVLLSNYFKLDHLATRMRRNADSLLVLAGVDRPGLRGPQDIDEVVRAGISEIEDYRRIDVLALDHVEVTGRAATTLGHLIAELLDNATSFSPPEARVRVAGNAAPGGYEIMVADSGIGISEARLVELNRKLELPPEVGAHGDASIGLAVVSMLAARIDAQVSLAIGEAGGTVATLHVPSSALHSAESAGAVPSMANVPPSAPVPVMQPSPPALALPVVETSLLSMSTLTLDSEPVPGTPAAIAASAETPSPIAVEAANAIAKLTLTASGLPMRPRSSSTADDREPADASHVGVPDRDSGFWPPPNVSPAGESNSSPAALATAFGSLQVAESSAPRPVMEPYPDRIGAAMASFARQRPAFDGTDSSDRTSN